VSRIEQPTAQDIEQVKACLIAAVDDVHATGNDLSSRLGAENRAASSKVRELLRAQW